MFETSVVFVKSLIIGDLLASNDLSKGTQRGYFLEGAHTYLIASEQGRTAATPNLKAGTAAHRGAARDFSLLVR